MPATRPTCARHLSLTRLATLVLAAVVLLPPSTIRADLYYELVSSLTPVGQEGQEGPTRKLKVYVRHRMVRAEDIEARKVIIARLDKGLIWGINEADGTYSEVPIKELGDDWKEAQRDAGENKPAKAAVTVEEGSTEETIAGYPCRKYTLIMDGQPLLHTWNTTAIDVPEKKDLYDYIQARGGFPKALLDKARGLPGFPLRVRDVENIGTQKVAAFREITLIKFDPVDAKLFELPQGLKQIEVK